MAILQARSTDDIQAQKHRSSLPRLLLKRMDLDFLQEAKITSLTDLIPGDRVYFMNYSDYEKQHPKGMMAGEYAIYQRIQPPLTEPTFEGFGPDPVTYEGMTQNLKKEYGKDKGLEKVEDADVLGGKLPGLSKTIG